MTTTSNHIEITNIDTTKVTSALVFYDTQDPKNPGWVLRWSPAWMEGEHEDLILDADDEDNPDEAVNEAQARYLWDAQ